MSNDTNAGTAAPVLCDYLTRGELAAELHRCEKTIMRWEAMGEGPPCTRVGRRPMYRRAAILHDALSPSHVNAT